jgi:type II secretory pathway pseudopilin PulG
MSARRAFTITELLVVIGVIVVIAGVLLAALSAVKGTGEMTDAMNRMRQIGVWMQAYSADNRDTILPSAFDYSGNPYTGAVRTGNLNPATPDQHRGSWADILWSEHEILPLDAAGSGYDYRHDSPDARFYQDYGTGWGQNPLRSPSTNSRNALVPASCDPTPTPHGCGAQESGLPGYFAASNFFDSRSGSWFSTGQILRPNQSMYLVDSFAGETIDPVPDPFYNVPQDNPSDETLEVDFRYNGLCLMLFLDAHVDPINPWTELVDLEGCLMGNGEIQKGRDIRVRNLTSRNPPDCP